VLHWGHVQVDEYDVKLSTSTIKELIETGELTGWDDPRAPTIQSMRRRGIQGQALVDSMTALGMSTSDVDLAMSSVYANNRDLVDDEANRYFFVRDRDDDPAVELPVVDGDASAPETGHPPLHPDYPDRGEREVPAGRIAVESSDLPSEGERVWLKGYGCVRYEGDELTFVGASIDVVRDGDVDVIHWAPADEGLDTLLRTVSGDVRGIAEPAVAEVDPDTVVQFVRVGFARIDAFDPEATDEPDGPTGEEDLLAYYAHP